MFRLMLAATLTANYGIYGPAYELCENAPAKPAPGKTESEEYLMSEKYEIRQRDRNAPGSLVPLITTLNQIRRSNPALQSNESLQFPPHRQPQDDCYSKTTPDLDKMSFVVIVNLDPYNQQSGWTDLDLGRLGLLPGESFVVEDLSEWPQLHLAWSPKLRCPAARRRSRRHLSVSRNTGAGSCPPGHKPRRTKPGHPDASRCEQIVRIQISSENWN